MLNSRAIVLRKYRLTESSLIAELLSEELGKFRVVAKGALKPRSRLAGSLDLFHLLEVKVVFSRRSELHSLTDAVLIEPYKGIREKYTRMTTAAYFARLLSLSLADETPAEDIFALLQKALAYLAANKPTIAVIERFEERLVSLLGLSHSGNPPDQVLAEHVGRDQIEGRTQALESFE